MRGTPDHDAVEWLFMMASGAPHTVTKSGRKEELLIPKEDLNRIWVLRKVIPRS